MAERRVLIVGGYGAFGARLAERLAREADLTVIIAGRDGGRAADAAAGLRRTARATIGSAAIDAGTPDRRALAHLAPAVIINASGPFQAQDYTLARAAIASGAHYIDLADARAFVMGIGALDDAARAAGVLIVSGASTVPAVSAAVIDHYAKQFQTLRAIDIGIAPGNSFDPGLATTQSILRGLAEPISILQNGHVGTVHGWEYLRRRDIPGLGKRWLATCDVPDLELFPKRYASVETVTFGAGVEIGLFHIGLATIAGLKRLGVVRRPENWAAALLAIKRRLSFLGSDRGGMAVTLAGTGHDGQFRRIDWFLVAGSGHGPIVPTIAATILARRLARGEISERGAKPCVGLVSLDDMLDDVSDLDISAREGTTPLYRRTLGRRFAQLPPVVRDLHDVTRTRTWTGRADVRRGTTRVARVLATLFSLPPEGRDQPLRVTFEPRDGREIWSRAFGDKLFRTVQSEGAGVLLERAGIVRFSFGLETTDARLRLKLQRLHVLGLPVPRALHPAIETDEREVAGRYHFDVAARLPLIGQLVHYTGWLEAQDST